MKSGLDKAGLQTYMTNRAAQNSDLAKELEGLRAEAVKLGLVKG
jgi:hypothetical protein